MSIKSILLILIVFCETGCAVFLDTKYATISVNSNPSGAEIYVMGKFAGITPTEIKVRKGAKSIIVDLLKLDYKPNRFFIYSKGQDFSTSTYCKLDYTLGWLLFGIPVQFNKYFSKKCYAFYKTSFDITLIPEEIIEISIPPTD